MNQTILVVDDDPQLLAILSELLHDEGYQVRRATDGLMALSEIEIAAPELVLSDVAMPRLDGMELARRLAMRPVPLPVILMSATQHAPPGGRPPFIAKPFSLDDLLRLIARCLQDGPRSLTMNGAHPR